MKQLGYILCSETDVCSDLWIFILIYILTAVFAVCTFCLAEHETLAVPFEFSRHEQYWTDEPYTASVMFTGSGTTSNKLSLPETLKKVNKELMINFYSYFHSHLSFFLIVHIIYFIFHSFILFSRCHWWQAMTVIILHSMLLLYL